jgi:cytochrome c-type biogenesis protein CcmH
MRALVFAFLAFTLAGPAGAVEPGEILADPVLERRARDISKNLRCLVCQNQSIDDSNADLARDLRVLVRERLVMGDSDSAVIRYIVDRYGDYVLLDPPFKGSTYVLWFGPGVIFAFGAAAVVLFLRRRRSLAPPPLTEEEEKRIEALMDDGSR